MNASIKTLLIVAAIATGSCISATPAKKIARQQFENSYAALFGKKPSNKVWNLSDQRCDSGTGGCKVHA